MTIGLIGYGRFGALACKHIAGKADVVVHDRRTASYFKWVV